MGNAVGSLLGLAGIREEVFLYEVCFWNSMKIYVRPVNITISSIFILSGAFGPPELFSCLRKFSFNTQMLKMQLEEKGEAFD